MDTKRLYDRFDTQGVSYVNEVLRRTDIDYLNAVIQQAEEFSNLPDKERQAKAIKVVATLLKEKKENDNKIKEFSKHISGRDSKISKLNASIIDKDRELKRRKEEIEQLKQETTAVTDISDEIEVKSKGIQGNLSINVRYVLLDYENIGSLDGIEDLTALDTVIIPVHKATIYDTVKSKLISLKYSCRVVVKLLDSTGKNSVDMAIVSFIGKILLISPNSFVYVISKDRDFKTSLELTGGYTILTSMKDIELSRIEICGDIEAVTTLDVPLVTLVKDVREGKRIQDVMVHRGIASRPFIKKIEELEGLNQSLRERLTNESNKVGQLQDDLGKLNKFVELNRINGEELDKYQMINKTTEADLVKERAKVEELSFEMEKLKKINQSLEKMLANKEGKVNELQNKLDNINRDREEAAISDEFKDKIMIRDYKDIDSSVEELDKYLREMKKSLILERYNNKIINANTTTKGNIINNMLYLFKEMSYDLYELEKKKSEKIECEIMKL